MKYSDKSTIMTNVEQYKKEKLGLWEIAQTIERYKSIVRLYHPKRNRNPMHNHSYRETLFIHPLAQMTNIDISEIIVSPCGVTGVDFVIPKLNITNGEMKSCEHKALKLSPKNLGKLEYDKQNSPIRRQEMDQFQATGFSLFDNLFNIIFSFYTTEHEVFNKLVQIEHKKFMAEGAKKDAQGLKLSRDSIKINVYDLIQQMPEQDFVMQLYGQPINKESLFKFIFKKQKSNGDFQGTLLSDIQNELNIHPDSINSVSLLPPTPDPFLVMI